MKVLRIGVLARLIPVLLCRNACVRQRHRTLGVVAEATGSARSLLQKQQKGAGQSAQLACFSGALSWRAPFDSGAALALSQSATVVDVDRLAVGLSAGTDIALYPG